MYCFLILSSFVKISFIHILSIHWDVRIHGISRTLIDLKTVCTQKFLWFRFKTIFDADACYISINTNTQKISKEKQFYHYKVANMLSASRYSTEWTLLSVTKSSFYLVFLFISTTRIWPRKFLISILYISLSW